MTAQQQRLAAALAPFGWTCTEEFWRRYYTDAWVFNLANAVEALTDRLDASRIEEVDGETCTCGHPWSTHGHDDMAQGCFECRCGHFAAAAAARTEEVDRG